MCSYGPYPGSNTTAPQPFTPAVRTEQEKQEYRKAMEAADQKIADEVEAHSQLMKNLEYLTTSIGPRLTGSPQMQAATHHPASSSNNMF